MSDRGFDGRWLGIDSGDAVGNMAIDAAVLENVQPHDGWTLRLYGWNPPALSLGYFQQVASRSQHSGSSDLTLVRRSTGGGAIVHHHELTYSLVVGDSTLQKCIADDADFEPTASIDVGAEGKPTGGDRTRWWYRVVHGAVMTALKTFGIPSRFADDRRGNVQFSADAFLCFARRADEDVEVCGYKVLGSAQRRSRGGRLMHGSLLLAASEHAPELPGIYELTGKRPGWAELATAIRGELAQSLRIQWSDGHLREAELATAQKAMSERFGSASWTQRR